MTNKEIQQLIDKYLEGETTPVEEQQLARALQLCQELPADWQAVRLMLGELTLGEAAYDDIMAQRRHKPSALLIALRTILSAAAIYLVGLFLWLQQDTAAPVQIVAQQQDIREAGSTRCSEGTPLEQYLCYMEYKKEQPNTFSKLRQQFYGNK